MKYVQLNNITRKMFVLKSHAENETGRQVKDFFSFLEKLHMR